MTILPSILAVYRDRRTLLARHREQLAAGRIVLQRDLDLRVGSAVCLDIAIANESLCVQALATVAAVVPATRESTGGLSLDFAETSRGLATALQDDTDIASALFICRRARRFHTRFDAVCRQGGSSFTGRVRDISRTGLFLQTPVLIPVATTVNLRLLPDCREALIVTAAVARHGLTGMGLTFLSCAPDSLSPFRELYAQIQARALRLEVAAGHGCA